VIALKAIPLPIAAALVAVISQTVLVASWIFPRRNASPTQIVLAALRTHFLIQTLSTLYLEVLPVLGWNPANFCSRVQAGKRAILARALTSQRRVHCAPVTVQDFSAPSAVSAGKF